MSEPGKPKAPRPIILEVNNGEDYIIAWVSRHGNITVTSVMGNYELEQQISQAIAENVLTEIKNDLPDARFIQSIIIDH